MIITYLCSSNGIVDDMAVLHLILNIRLKYIFFIANYFLISQCLANHNYKDNDNILNCFAKYLNNRPDVGFKYEKTSLLYLQELKHDEFKIEVQLKGTNINNKNDVRSLQCTAKLEGKGDCPEIVNHTCHEQAKRDDTKGKINEEIPVLKGMSLNVDNDIAVDANNLQHRTSISSTNSARHKRQIYGGITEEDVNNPKYLVLLEESLKKFHMSGIVRQYHKVVQFLRVTEQIIQGLMTRLYFRLAPTDCQVNADGEASSSACKVLKNSRHLLCESKIWEKPYPDPKEVFIQCNVERPKSQTPLLGGIKEENPNDPQFRELIEESLIQYHTISGATQLHHVVNIEKVTTQVVEGMLTRVYFKIAPLNCWNIVDTDTSPSMCRILGNYKECRSEIWEKPWENFKQINITCEGDEKPRVKRILLGGEQDPGLREDILRH